MQPADIHDERLLAQVRPVGWRNPTPAGRYHLVVIGGGTAGLVGAAGAAGLGARVALIEREWLGGDCLNVGCVPSKALIRSARAAAVVREAGRFGVRVPAGVRVDFPAVMERMRRLRADISPHDSAERFRGLGVDVFLGHGRFTGPDVVAVGGQRLAFRRALIATGARASRAPVAGLAEAGILTNETVFSLTELTARLAIIGAGPIGCELAQVFARFGAEVTLLGRQAQVLPREDARAASLVHQALERDGVRLILGRPVDAVERRAGGKVVRIEGEDRAEVAVDQILVATGRRPNVEDLGLEAAGVGYDPRQGVRVDNYLRTTNRRVFAAGDVCSSYKFTHAADAMARVVVQNALFLGRARVSSLVMPWCTYTDPEVARVGLSERQAKERGVAVRSLVQELKDVDRAVLDGETDGFVQVLTPPRGGRILGATVVAAHAGEMISELTLAMVAGRGLRTLARTIHPYPTQAEAIRKVADAYNRTRLTPFAGWLLRKWLAWRG